MAGVGLLSLGGCNRTGPSAAVGALSKWLHGGCLCIALWLWGPFSLWLPSQDIPSQPLLNFYYLQKGNTTKKERENVYERSPCRDDTISPYV